jgi:hypothetical protein
MRTTIQERAPHADGIATAAQSGRTTPQEQRA